MDKVVLLLLADVGFFRTDNGEYANWTYQCRVEPKELEQAEQAADKLENWINNLSL